MFCQFLLEMGFPRNTENPYRNRGFASWPACRNFSNGFRQTFSLITVSGTGSPKTPKRDTTCGPRKTTLAKQGQIHFSGVPCASLKIPDLSVRGSNPKAGCQLSVGFSHTGSVHFWCFSSCASYLFFSLCGLCVFVFLSIFVFFLYFCRRFGRFRLR